MRALALLLALGLALTLTLTSAAADATTTAKPENADSNTTPKPDTVTQPTDTKTKTRQSKALKHSASASTDTRGKRTLYDFGNAGYLYSDVANRRAGYVDTSSAYYPQPGFYNGQNAIGQFAGGYGPSYGPYPQYLEAPEPIIEIIIKDANETLAEAALPPPVLGKRKKKKEKVHVFYVNYKKDQNNKLHLETPIASLNNDDNEEEEEEEQIDDQYLPAATPLPPLKATTLRTIIHPDSEKYHSNSGIHVSFGAEDNRQTGHILEEHDAESIQRQVVALPLPTGIKTDSNFALNTRADYARENSFGRAVAAGPNFLNNAYHQASAGQFQQFQSQQQLPAQHSTNYFRPPGALIGPGPSSSSAAVKSSPQQQFYKQQAERNGITQQQLPSTSSQSIFNKLVQQSQYYVNHNQQYHQQPQQPQQPQQYQQHQQQQQHHHHQQQQQQSHQSQSHQQQLPLQQSAQQFFKSQSKPQQQQQVPFFPTPLPPSSKPQELPLRVSASPYQPIKFRPTPAPAASLQIKAVKQTQASAQQQLPQQTSAYQQSSKLLPSYQFQRQPQFVQQPQFTVRAPTSPPEYYQQQQVQPVQAVQTVQQQPQQQLTKIGSLATQTGISGLHTYFDIKPSKETELLKSIPKFEQHITETVLNPIIPQQQVQQAQYSTQYSGSSSSGTRNEVIHDIPAPNLGPAQPAQPTQATLSGHYITATQQSQQAQQAAAQAQYPAPAVYAESTHGQKVMVITPVPPTVADYAAYSQYNGASLQAQASTNFAQQPRQQSLVTQVNAVSAGDNSPYSVSTYHSDVFKELEYRHKQQLQQQQQQQQQGQQSPQIYAPAPTVATKPATAAAAASVSASASTASPSPAAAPNNKASQTLLQLPDEVPDDLRQQLFSSGILNNADISVLDYDKEGDIALENLPAEHLQHFYGAGGGAQIAETNKVLTVVKPNGDKVAIDEKQLDRVKPTNSLPQKQNLDIKVVRYDAHDAQQQQSVSEKYLRTDATVVTPVAVSSNEAQQQRQYNRYLPLKINGAQFPIPESEELLGKRIVSVVVLAPVEAGSRTGSSEARSAVDNREVKFLGGDLIKTLVKKPTKDNFKRWLEKEARTDLELQSVVLLVAKSSEEAEQEIFMYDISSGNINKLNGELSSTFVNVAEENASSEDLEHAATLDHSSLESMMHDRRRR